MFKDWCEIEETPHTPRKALVTLSERDDGRAVIEQELAERVRSHYDGAGCSMSLSQAAAASLRSLISPMICCAAAGMLVPGP